MSHYVKYFSALSAGALMGCSQFAMAPTDATPKMQPMSRITSPVSEVETLFTLGRTAHGLGQRELAEGRYAKVLILQPEHVGALNGMAVIYAQTQRPVQADALFQRALAIAPQAAYLHNNWGYALMLAGRLNEAQDQLNQAMVLDATSVLTRKNQALLALALERGRDKDSALGQASTQPVPPEGPQLVALSAHVYELRDATALPLVPALLNGLKIEVSNGVGIPNLAHLTAKRLASLGVITARMTNQPGYKQIATEIYYSPGQLNAAQALSVKLPMGATMRASHDLGTRVQMRLVLGRDMGPVAHFGEAPLQPEDDHVRDHSSPLPLVALRGEGAFDLGV